MGVLELEIAPSSTGGELVGKGCRCSELRSVVVLVSLVPPSMVLSNKELSWRRESLRRPRELSSSTSVSSSSGELLPLGM